MVTVKTPVDTVLRHQKVVAEASNLIKSLFFFFSAFLKEYLPQHVFLLFMRIIVFYIIVMRLIKYGI